MFFLEVCINGSFTYTRVPVRSVSYDNLRYYCLDSVKCFLRDSGCENKSFPLSAVLSVRSLGVCADVHFFFTAFSNKNIRFMGGKSYIEKMLAFYVSTYSLKGE